MASGHLTGHKAGIIFVAGIATWGRAYGVAGVGTDLAVQKLLPAHVGRPLSGKGGEFPHHECIEPLAAR